MWFRAVGLSKGHGAVRLEDFRVEAYGVSALRQRDQRPADRV